MRRNLGRSLLSFSFSRSNRIGSDELIALEKAQSHESREGLCVKSQTLESLPTSVNHLLQELAEKEMMINDLRRKLENLEQCEKSVMKKPSMGAWLRRISRRSSSTCTSVLSSEGTSRRESRLSDQSKRVLKSELQQLLMPSRSLPRYTYEELISGAICYEDLVLDNLEWHLTDEALLEWLGTCREFLGHLEMGDLKDRKYRVFLTREQYEAHRKIRMRLEGRSE